MRMKLNPIAPLMTGALLLSACEGAPAKRDMFDLCLIQTRVIGSYVVDETKVRPNGYPVVKVAKGGRRGDALALEDCLQNKMIAAGVPPVKPSAPRAAAGKLPLPVGYVLQPGDTKLWPTLTRAQQQRAIEFLKSGSTIRSSLAGDQ